MSVQAHSAGGPLVLVVAEQAQESASLSEVLMMDGYRVLVAATADQALMFAEQVMPDLILIDLPESQESDTFRIPRELKEEARTASILTVVLVTQETADRFRGSTAGDRVDAMLTHPWSMSTLLPKLSELIASQSS